MEKSILNFHFDYQIISLRVQGAQIFEVLHWLPSSVAGAVESLWELASSQLQDLVKNLSYNNLGLELLPLVSCISKLAPPYLRDVVTYNPWAQSTSLLIVNYPTLVLGAPLSSTMNITTTKKVLKDCQFNFLHVHENMMRFILLNNI